MLDTSWWTLLLIPYATVDQKNSANKYYELLPWLKDAPLEHCLRETYDEDTNDWRSRQRAQMGFYGCIRESCHYMLRRGGLSKASAKIMSHAYRRQMFSMMFSDLKNPAILSLSESDQRLLRISCQQLSYSALKLAQKQPTKLGWEIMARTRTQVTEALELIDRKVCYEEKKGKFLLLPSLPPPLSPSPP